MRLRAGLRAWRVNSFGAQPDVRLDQRGIEANPPRRRIDVGAGVLQHRARLVMQEVDADLLQDRRARPDGSIRARRCETRSSGANGECGWPAGAAAAPPPRSTARRRRRRAPYPAAAVGRHVGSPDLRRPRARLATAPIAIGRRRRSSGAAYTRLAPKWHRGMPIRAKASRTAAILPRAASALRRRRVPGREDARPRRRKTGR